MRAALLVFCTFFPAIAAAERAPIVVVTNIEDHTGRFAGEKVEQWRNHLAARITASRKYRAAAPGDVRALLAQIKHDSFREGFDENGRAGVGRELPASKVLDVQLYDASGTCAVVAALYDLERAVADRAFSQTTDCTEERLRASFDAIASSITGVELEPDPVPEISSPRLPWRVRAELFSLSMGFASTAGGASGPLFAASLFGVRYGFLYATLLDAGTTVFASKGEGFDTVDHSMIYGGTTGGLALTFGSNDEHELRAGGGLALYRAAAEPDFFTGLKVDADETDGLVPAAIADARYVYRMTADEPIALGFGGGFRAIIPLGAPLAGDPRMAMVHLFLSFGST